MNGALVTPTPGHEMYQTHHKGSRIDNLKRLMICIVLHSRMIFVSQHDIVTYTLRTTVV